MSPRKTFAEVARPGWRRRAYNQKLPLGNFVAAYLIGITLFSFAVLLSQNIGVAVVAYGVVGIVLTRYFSRRMQASPSNATLKNVVRAKLTMFVMWPTSIPALLFYMLAHKLL